MSPPKKNRSVFFYRRLIAVVAINVLPLLVLSGLLYTYIISDYKSNLIAMMNNQIMLLATTSESALLFDDAEAGERVLSTLELNETIQYTQIYNANNQLFAQYRHPEIINDTVIEHFDKAVEFKNNNIYLNYKIMKNGEYLGLIVMSASTEGLAAQKDHLLMISVLTLLGSFILASLLNWTLQKRLNTPIRDLISLVHYVTEHKRYHKRLDTDQNNEFGDIIAWVNTMLDTMELHENERKASSAKIIQASKLATLGEMATSVAHELNQPLNVIRMAADNCRRKVSTGTADTEYLYGKLCRIEQQTVRAAAIIDHMRMFGRKAEEDPAPVDPRKVVTNSLNLMGEQLRLAGIELVTELAEDCPFVLGHTIQLEQVLLNLLTNARDAIVQREGEAKITLRVFFDDEGVHICTEDTGGGIPEEILTRIFEPFFTTKEMGKGTGLGLCVGFGVFFDDEGVHICTEDTGGGIPEEILTRIFEPFFTTKEMGKGTGLGLSVGYGIIRDMNGTIVVENIDNGARFKILLPSVRRIGKTKRHFS